MNLTKVTLPTYSKTEEIINAVSHGLGVPLGIVACIICLMKSSDINSTVGSIIFALSVVILYSCSTLYHSVKNTTTKKFLRLIDHSSIFILITGTSVAMTIICVYPHSKLFAIIMSSISMILSIVGVILTIVDQEKYKKVQMRLYLIVGWISVVLVYPIYKYCENGLTIILIVAAGGIIYTVGAVFYSIGKKKKYFHCIFHMFVLCGTILHLYAVYSAI